MQSYYAAAKQRDARLWVIALGLSLVINVLLLAALGMASIASLQFRKKNTRAPEEKKPAEVTVQIYPEMLRPKAPEKEAPKTAAAIEPLAPPPPVVTPAKPEMARTSEDQRGKRPDKPAFIGERDTEATSDRAPDASAPPLPSQKGRKPRDESDIETTDSAYRDGKLPLLNQPAQEAASPPSDAAAPAEQAPSEPAAPEPAAPAAAGQPSTLPPPRENTLEGPEPMEVPVPREQKESIKPSQEVSQTPSQKGTKPKKPDVPITKMKQVIDDPAFSGNQKKTAIRGSISRTGRSSLDVADTPLGRYQAILSRAVELEWQRNCTRHRDFITPGYLTIRFFVDPNGKVRRVQFVDGQTPEIQKGFTLNAIRDADIPPMPAALKDDYAKEPLELIFNFYF